MKARKEQSSIICLFLLFLMILSTIPIQTFAEKETSQNIAREKEDLVNNLSLMEGTADKEITVIASPELETSSETADIAIDEVHFPDPKFRECVKKHDKNSDGILSQEELDAVTNIDCASKGIKDLKGVEYFTKLEELDCETNSLRTLDLSKNLTLRKLHCGYNSLRTLDLSHNLTLEELNCQVNSISTLNVKNNPALKKLNCYTNKLSTLNIKNNPALEELNCHKNNLSTLDLSQNSALVELHCEYNNLSTLDLSNNPQLEALYCLENNLSTLDINKNPALKKLNCHTNKLRTLNIKNNPALEELNCYKNKLSTLNISKNPILRVLNCDYNKISTLDLSNNPNLEELDCNYNQLTSLDLSKNEKINSFNGYDEEYPIKVDKKDLSFELTSLPGNFNPALTSDWEKASVLGSILKLPSSKPSFVKYRYKVIDNYTLRVTLKVTYADKVVASFDAGEGSGKMEKAKVFKNSSYKLPDCTFTAPAGKRFNAWEVKGEEKQVGEEITLKEDITVKALWKDKPVVLMTEPKIDDPQNLGTKIPDPEYAKVEFKAGEGEIEGITKYYVLKGHSLSESSDFAEPKARKAGSTFKAWTPTFDKTAKIKDNTRYMATFEEIKFDPSNVLSMEVKEQPTKLTYSDGENLNLDGLVVSLKDNKGLKKDIAFADFDANNINANPASGIKLSLSDNEKAITLTRGSLQTETAKLKINALVKVVTNPKASTPKGYVRVIFDATEKGKIDGTNRYKVLDILKGTTWDNVEVISEIPVKAIYNDGTKEFKEWDSTVPTDGKVVSQKFDAIYKAKAVIPVTPNPSLDDSDSDCENWHTSLWSSHSGSSSTTRVIANATNTVNKSNSAKSVKLEVRLAIGLEIMRKSTDVVEEKIKMDVAPFIEKGRTMLPIRFVAEALGFNVQWDNENRIVILIDKENLVKIPVDTKEIIVNGKVYESDVKPVLRKDRTMLPIANIARALGLKDGKDIIWNENTKEVVIMREIGK
ncbi:hypothetical protein HKO22_06005 [Peptoniphilus sp. AGMB00490]|uniref:EF-hand domain-containing protein n=1 Tax=Peptoniphilus faecalis TaxID=2731255 RepID=A0A848REN4_9FIRM|nr:stalk domain-containing protein [Peptoniphilus faecalis]NMW85290.1 hypothetical protein [Peptoniphilus faecalis]